MKKKILGLAGVVVFAIATLAHSQYLGNRTTIDANKMEEMVNYPISELMNKHCIYKHSQKRWKCTWRLISDNRPCTSTCYY